MLRTLAAIILTLATPWLGAQTSSTSNLKEAINVIVLFCVAGGEKFELAGDVSAEGGLLLKKAGASAQGSLKITKSEAKGLVDGLNRELSNVNAAQASEARACMKPYIDRILSLLIGANTTPTTTIVKLGSCIGRGGLEGVHLWGPEGEKCNGVAAWGMYMSVSSAQAPSRLCSCIGRGGPNGVRLWGPEGKHCAGIQQWGTYDSDCVTTASMTLCACQGRGNILGGHMLWGPKGKACGGMSNKAWGEYDQYCVAA